MTLFKSRVGKVIFAQTTGGLSVIIPFFFSFSLKLFFLSGGNNTNFSSCVVGELLFN